MNDQERSQGKGKPLDLGKDTDRPRTTGTVPTAQPVAAPKAEAKPAAKPAPKPAAPAPAPPPAPRQLTQHQKQMLNSAFIDNATSRVSKAKAVVGNTAEKKLYDDDDEPTSLAKTYDGETVLPELAGRDVWKAIQAPLQSREGRRTAELYQNVINQFAVGTNPRYEPDEGGRPRGHIYIWDVSRAMNCEVPHFVGAKELTLAQTCDWIRHEAPMRGWVRASLETARAAALAGQMVVVLPREVKVKQMAILIPLEELNDDGKPFVAAAAAMRGGKLKLNEALGVFAAEYLVHP